MGLVSREQEKEVQSRKRGKRPRGRPRKLTVMSCNRHAKLQVGCCGTLLQPGGARERGKETWGEGSPLHRSLGQQGAPGSCCLGKSLGALHPTTLGSGRADQVPPCDRVIGASRLEVTMLAQPLARVRALRTPSTVETHPLRSESTGLRH